MDNTATWLDVEGAAAHLAMTEWAIRHLVAKQKIPFHRTPNRRIRFRPEELDAWARGEVAA